MIRSECPSSRSAGFTLIEALIVVALMGILAMFTLPALFNFIERSKLESTVRQAASQVQLARLDAIKTGAATTVTVDTAARMMRVTRADGRQISMLPLPTGISFGTPIYTATLAADGSVDAVGSFLFVSDRNNDNQMRVRIGPEATARTVIEKLDKNSSAADPYFEAPWKWY